MENSGQNNSQIENNQNNQINNNQQQKPSKINKLKFFLRKFISLKLLLPLIILIAIVATAAGVYFFTQYQNAQKQLSSASEPGVLESQRIIDAVSKLIVLPSDEEPSVAIVSDIEKLKDQPFFKSAKNGDKVLIYAQNKKAIIYRPSTNKIIEVATVSLDQGSNKTTAETTSVTPSISPTQSPTPTSTPIPTQTPTPSL